MRRKVSCSRRPARAFRPSALSAMRVEGALVVPLQRVLAAQGDARRPWPPR